jgi:hypothetical protein
VENKLFKVINLDISTVETWRDEVAKYSKLTDDYNRYSFLKRPNVQMTSIELSLKQCGTKAERLDAVNHINWSDDTFFTRLLAALQSAAHNSSGRDAEQDTLHTLVNKRIPIGYFDVDKNEPPATDWIAQNVCSLLENHRKTWNHDVEHDFIHRFLQSWKQKHNNELTEKEKRPEHAHLVNRRAHFLHHLETEWLNIKRYDNSESNGERVDNDHKVFYTTWDFIRSDTPTKRLGFLFSDGIRKFRDTHASCRDADNFQRPASSNAMYDGYHGTAPYSGRGGRHGKRPRDASWEINRKGDKNPRHESTAPYNPNRPKCNGCGRYFSIDHSSYEACAMKTHEDFNHEANVPFTQSAKGKAYLARFNQPYLMMGCRLSDSSSHATNSNNSGHTSSYNTYNGGGRGDYRPHGGGRGYYGYGGGGGRGRGYGRGGRSYYGNNTYRSSTSSSGTTDEIIMTIDDSVEHSYQHASQNCIQCIITVNARTLQIAALLDTGALDGNYVSADILEWIKSSHGQVTSCASTNICSAFSNMCSQCIAMTEFKVKLVSEVLSKPIEFSLHAKAINSPYDLIIGRPAIKQFDLVTHCKSQFTLDVTSHTITGSAGQAELVSVLSDGSQERYDSQSLWPKLASLEVGQGLIKQKYELLEITATEDDETQNMPSITTVLPLEVTNDNDNLPPMMGTGGIHDKIRALCEKYSDIFRLTVCPEPADIKPMHMDVDLSRWEVPANQCRPRPQTAAKTAEIKKQIDLMLDLNIIKRSSATYYSQVLLTPKPNGKFRFCVDYRRLNDCSKVTHTFPLPNITHMLQRLGQARFKWAATLDFTSGYHQTSLAEEYRHLAAFICEFGIFEPLRVFFGLKNAPSYYQERIAIEVLAEMLYIACELYIDDIIVHGKSDEEFLENLEKLFQRFREKHITLNPTKCRIGLAQLEYVGHVIDRSGISMSAARKDKILNFARPVTEKDLRSFIGLANYFRSHISHYSELLQPLQAMLNHKKYNRRAFVNWDSQTLQAFERVKVVISECPKLFFLTDTDPVYLHTDASDYGYGAYLFQKCNAVEHPVAFISKTFNTVQSRWSTIEKEAYAIFYAFKELAYLIRDRFFTLRTDHANLTYISDSGSPKVLRWKLFIQEYDFQIEHIAGPDNFVADMFSRLVAKNTPEIPNEDEHTEVLSVLDAYKIPDDRFTLIGEYHNSIAGHFGVERTLSKLRQNGHSWLLMREHVRSYIKHCPCCQKMSVLKPIIEAKPFTTATYEPMVRVSIDTVGPLPKKDGYEYVLVIIDNFTRFVELYPCKTTQAEEAAKLLLNHVGRYGIPQQLLSDMGPQFVNELISQLAKTIGTEHVKTLSYSKEENALVERANKEVQRHLRTFVYHVNVLEAWVDSLPLVQRIMNSTVHSSTGVSPAQLLFGNAVNLDRGIFLPAENETSSNNKRDNKKSSLSKWIDTMLSQQMTLLRIAAEIQEQKDIDHLREVGPDHPSRTERVSALTEFPVNSYVLVQYPHNSYGGALQGRPTKLHSYWKGPMRVVNQVGNKVVLHNLVSDKLEEHHVTALKQFRHYHKFDTPLAVACRDDQNFIVEAIRAHSGDVNRKSTLDFLVKWEGLSDDYNRWIPWKELRNNPKLHAYLIDNGLRKLVPKEHLPQVVLADED